MMKQTSVADVRVITLKEIIEEDGRIIPFELFDYLPEDFNVKRFFLVDQVNDKKTRGSHAHYETTQVISCPRGMIRLTCKDGRNTRVITLEKPNDFVFIPKMIWDEQIYLTEDTIMLSMASTRYDPSDYINDFNEFVEKKNVTRN